MNKQILNDKKSVYLTIGLNLCFITLLTISLMTSAQAKDSAGGFLDFNLYPYLSDVDNDSVFTINASAKLTNRLSYFSLINFINPSNDSRSIDPTTYYTEQNLRWQITPDSPFDLTMQLNFRSGEDNNRHRLGVRWRLNNTSYLQDIFNKLHMSYSINLHAIQFDQEEGDVWQLEHAFLMKFPYLSKDLYLFIFVDHTFNQTLPNNIPNNPIVAEAQLGYKIANNFYLITEYRINEYRRKDVNNLALGIEYKINW